MRFIIFVSLFIPFITVAQNNSKIKISVSDVDSTWGKYLPYKENGKYGYADSKGKVQIRPKWDTLLIFGDGVGRVSLLKKWGLTNAKGILLTKVIYDSIQYESYEGFYRPYIGGIEMPGFYARNGNIYSKNNVEMMYGDDGSQMGRGEDYYDFEELTFITMEGRKGIRLNLNLKGKADTIFYQFPQMYDEVEILNKYSSYGGSYLLKVKSSGKTGLILVDRPEIDLRLGEYIKLFHVIDPLYDAIEKTCSGDYYYLKAQNKYGIVRIRYKAFDIVCNPAYDSIVCLPNDNYGYYFKLKKNGLYGIAGYFDYFDLTLIEPNYKKIKSHKMGYSDRAKGDDSLLYLFYVTKPSGKSGFVTKDNIELFK